MFELVTDNSLPCLIRLPSQLSPVTRWVERCSQCTLVIFSLVSSGNMAKQFESSLLDEFCNQKLPSSQANFRITDMSCIRDAENVPYALLVERIQTSLVMPLSGSRHRHHTWSQGWCIHSAILSCLAEIYRISRDHDQGFSCNYVQALSFFGHPGHFHQLSWYTAQ